MTGGWSGSSGSYARTYWLNKQRHDAATAELTACQQVLTAATARQQHLEQHRAAAEAQLATAQHRQQLCLDLQQAQAEAARSAAVLDQEQQQLQELAARRDHLQAQQQQHQAALGLGAAAGGPAAAATKGTRGSSRAVPNAAQLQRQLQTEADEAAGAVAAAEQELDAAQEKVRHMGTASC